jgi:hypothetical protein
LALPRWPSPMAVTELTSRVVEISKDIRGVKWEVFRG